MTSMGRTRATLGGLSAALLTLVFVSGPGLDAGAGPVVTGAVQTNVVETGAVVQAAPTSYPRYGEQSARVRAVQNKLIAIGYLPAESNSGSFGPQPRPR